MKLTILTCASKEYWPLLAITSPNKLEYAIRYGFQLHVCQHTGDATCAGHERTQFMQDALAAYKTDWLWFMGADTLITNMSVDAREFCDDAYDFVIAEDVNGINNDSFFLRNSKASRKFLQRVLARHGGAAHDQEAMANEMHKGELRTKVVSQKLFNAYKYDEYEYGPQPHGTWAPGDFVLHMPGLPNGRRFELIYEFASKIQR